MRYRKLYEDVEFIDLEPIDEPKNLEDPRCNVCGKKTSQYHICEEILEGYSCKKPTKAELAEREKRIDDAMSKDELLKP